MIKNAATTKAASNTSPGLLLQFYITIGTLPYVQFAGYFFVGLMEFVQVYDSTYICHRFHLTAHLSEYLEREGFPSWGGQKRIGVSLNRGVKIESAKTKEKYGMYGLQ